MNSTADNLGKKLAKLRVKTHALPFRKQKRLANIVAKLVRIARARGQIHPKSTRASQLHCLRHFRKRY